MTLLDKILHPHGHKEEPQPETAPQEESVDTKASGDLPPPPQVHIPSTEPVLTDPPAEPRSPPNPVPQGQDPPHLTNTDRMRYPPPPMNQQIAFGNAGLLAGGVVGPMDGAGIGGGMMEGQVLGTMVGQRVHQAQNHAYWRERAMAFEAGDKTAVAAPPGPRTERAERREERRRERWEQRAGM